MDRLLLVLRPFPILHYVNEAFPERSQHRKHKYNLLIQIFAHRSVTWELNEAVLEGVTCNDLERQKGTQSEIFSLRLINHDVTQPIPHMHKTLMENKIQLTSIQV